jgi:flagellar basal body-associated protein FliL
MKLLKIILIIALLLTVVTSVSATVFFSGNKYMKFSENEKLHYVAGLSDMTDILLKTLNPEKYQEFKEITKNVTLGQIVKIFDKFLEENPEELHHSTSSLFFAAIDEVYLSGII